MVLFSYNLFMEKKILKILVRIKGKNKFVLNDY